VELSVFAGDLDVVVAAVAAVVAVVVVAAVAARCDYWWYSVVG
jgi:hypothetical protein